MILEICLVLLSGMVGFFCGVLLAAEVNDDE